MLWAILAGAGSAAAQAPTPQERIDAALARARQAGTPVALLESKIAEGRAKGVSLDRVAAAIERRQAALERASQALGAQVEGPTGLAVAADAIESGVSDAVLRAAAESAPRDRRTVAIAALTELVHQGHPPESALARVRDAVRRGPDALANLPAEAAAGRRGGGPPEGRGRGNAFGRGASEPGPPESVPAPGRPPQSGRPDSPGRSGDAGRGNAGDSAGGANAGGANAGGGPPSNPGRGNR